MPSIPENIRAQLGDYYDFERELVGGGMARVFLAEDRELHRRVVVKVLPAELGLGVSAKRFRSEILTVAKLQHPHIVGILRAGEVDGVPESSDVTSGPLSVAPSIGAATRSRGRRVALFAAGL